MSSQNVIYTTPDQMFRVVEENGKYFPEELVIACPSYCDGRLYDMKLIESLMESPFNKVRNYGWNRFYGGYKQFSTEYKGDKSYKSANPAIKFVDRLSEQVKEVA